MSQWSGRWGKSTDKAFADYVKDLGGRLGEDLRRSTAPDEVIERAQGPHGALGSVRSQAESSKYIDDLAVLLRDRVHDYYLPLWLWHRLDGQRWKASAIPLRESKRGSLSLDVDHIVAVKLWETLPGAQPQADSEDESALSADDLSTTMNALGNCCLLEKSFNIAKWAYPFGAFLQRVHEFKSDGGDGTGKLNIADWTRDLGVDAMLVDPTGKPAADVRVVVEARTAKMKAELKESTWPVRASAATCRPRYRQSRCAAQRMVKTCRPARTPQL